MPYCYPSRMGRKGAATAAHSKENPEGASSDSRTRPAATTGPRGHGATADFSEREAGARPA